MTIFAPDRYRDAALNALRIVVGIMFFSHGAQKTLGWFGGFGADGGTAELLSRFGVAGMLETVGGLAIILGLFTRPVAFILAGEMAVAYFWSHVGRGGLWWWANRGELAVLYCFVFLLIAAHGAGSLSVDRARRRRRPTATPAA